MRILRPVIYAYPQTDSMNLIFFYASFPVVTNLFSLFVSQSIGEGNGNPLQYSCRSIPQAEEPGGLYSPRGRKSWM